MITVAREVEDVLALAAVIGEPTMVVGHSSGGAVALEALAAEPSAFAGAVLYEPPVAIGPAAGSDATDRARSAIAAGQITDLDGVGLRLDTYARISVPTVLLGGERSPAHLGERLDVLAATIPHARKVVPARRDHSAHLRAPAEVAQVIGDLADEVLS